MNAKIGNNVEHPLEKIFYPETIVIIGLSSKPTNISRVILENLLRWGFRGKIFGMNPRSEEAHVDGVKMYKEIEDLPQVPDLAVCLIPARLIPDHVERCGEFGIKRMAIPSGGFAEFSEDGERLAQLTLEKARHYGVRFVGPNGLTVANTANGLCLPFIPLYRPPTGEISVISQSGGLGIILWNQLSDENLGVAKFASIGNKLDLDEVDFLEYFGSDLATHLIFVYLESIKRGKELVRAASDIDKPIIVLKSNTTSAGKRAAMSHTAALSNDDDIIDAALERAGVVRVHNFRDFIAMAKGFQLPPMKGNRIMVMCPAGGFSVVTADLCEKAGFEFAHPGDDFYQGLRQYSNAGVIRFSNPLDMGDIYDPRFTAHVFFSVMHHENVDGALYVSEWPHMPEGDNVFSKMLRTDLSKETWGAILSSGKPVGICLFGASGTMSQIKKYVNFPIFDDPEEMVRAMAAQRDYTARRCKQPIEVPCLPKDRTAAEAWLGERSGIIGEEALGLLKAYGIPTLESHMARDEDEAMALAETIGYPVAVKVDSPDAIHKSEAKGVVLDIQHRDGVVRAFRAIKENLTAYKSGAVFRGVRVQKLAQEGYDMFIGGKQDPHFGPVVLFGLGGVYVEVFRDLGIAVCPTWCDELSGKVKKLKSFSLISGTRGKESGDIDGYINSIVVISHLLADFPQIQELDINPLRVFAQGSGVVALDARMRIGTR